MTPYLLKMLDEAYLGPAWHGPHLRGTVARLTAADAVWRPGAGRKRILDITVHAAYWKYAARRALRGDKRGSFPLKGSNWFALPAKISEAQWRAYRALLDEEHARLREAVEGIPASKLDFKPPGRKTTNLRLIYGVAMHDIYHAGQIQTLKALRKRGGGGK